MTPCPHPRAAGRPRAAGGAPASWCVCFSPPSHTHCSHRRQRSRSPPAPAKTTVYVSNLTRNVTAEHVREIFGTLLSAAMRSIKPAVVLTPHLHQPGFYGTVVSVDLPLDGHVRCLLPSPCAKQACRVGPLTPPARPQVALPKGYAVVQFQEASQAEEAVAHMDGGQVDGNRVVTSTQMPRPPPPPPPPPGPPGMGPRAPYGRGADVAPGPPRRPWDGPGPRRPGRGRDDWAPPGRGRGFDGGGRGGRGYGGGGFRRSPSPRREYGGRGGGNRPRPASPPRRYQRRSRSRSRSRDKYRRRSRSRSRGRRGRSSSSRSRSRSRGSSYSYSYSSDSPRERREGGGKPGGSGKGEKDKE